MLEYGDVLVVDDIVAIVEELVSLLELHGIVAHGATDLETAVTELLERPRIAVVVCDVRLGRESGFDIVTRILAHPDLRDRPFRYLFISGDSMQVQHFSRAAGHQILSKPVHPARLLKTIREMLDAHTHSPLPHDATSPA